MVSNALFPENIFNPCKLQAGDHVVISLRRQVRCTFNVPRAAERGVESLWHSIYVLGQIMRVRAFL
jgi:hypothetical protein